MRLPSELIVVTLGLLLWAGSPQVHAQPPGGASTDTGAPAPSATALPPELARDGIVPTGAVAARSRRLAEARAAAQDEGSLRYWLAVAALLALWLLARSEARRQQDAPRRPHRRVALSHDELGHLVFEVARSQDFIGFRDLFLNGPEAAQILGVDGAAHYLQLRPDGVLRRALEELGVVCAAGSSYAGVAPVQGGKLGLRVRTADGSERVVPVGTVTSVEGGCRIHMPA